MVKVARGEETSQKVIAKGFVNGHDSLGQDRGMGMERETLKKVHQIDLLIHWMWGWG